jgi:hypothetical protein
VNMKMFSDDALKAFKRFCEIDARTVKRPAGAADGVHDPRIRRALNRRGVAYDQAGAAPDPDTINSILEMLRGTLHDDAIVTIMKALDAAWPNCCGELFEEGEHVNDDFMKAPDAEDEADEDAGGTRSLVERSRKSLCPRGLPSLTRQRRCN